MILASTTSWLLGFDGSFELRLIQALLHFVWQGSVIAGIYAVVAWSLGASAANRRYAAGLVALGLMAACLPATFLAIGSGRPASADDRAQAALALPPAAAPGPIFSVPLSAGADVELEAPSARSIAVVELPGTLAPAKAESDGGMSWLAWLSPYALGGYFGGVALMLARLALGVWGGRRLRLASVACRDERILQLLARLARQIGLRSAPRIAWCAWLAGPVVVGVLRPTILLPTVLVTGLSTDQIQAILLHELIHIRRYDLLANLLQRLVEVILFFHPAVWWLSRRITIERENACDDAVLRLDCRRLQYADALLRVAELAAGSPPNGRNRLAQLAATGGHDRDSSQFRRRMLRVLGNEQSRGDRLAPSPIAIVLLLVAGAVFVPAVWRRSATAETILADAAETKAPAAEAKRQPPATATVVPAGPQPPAAIEQAAAPIEPAAELARPEAKATLFFERDSSQVTPSAFEVWSLAFSGNDQFLAASGGGSWSDQNPGQSRVWDFGKGKEVISYPAARGIETVALSPDGKRVALGCWGGDVWLREVGGAELLHEKFESNARVALSPDGKLLVAVTERNQLRTWDALTGKPLEKEEGEGGFRGGTFPFFWVGFSPDGKYLVACGGKKDEIGGVKFAVWNVATRQQLYKKKLDLDRIFSASISPDSQTLATSGEGSVDLWDLATGDRRGETEESGGTVYRVEFSPDGKLLASASYGTANVVTLWDPPTGTAVGTLSGHEGDVRAMAFTHDGRTLATGSADRSIRLWDVAARQQTSILQGPRTESDADGASTAILAVAYSPDGNSVATGAEDGQVTVYGPSPRGVSRSWTAHADAVAAIAFSPDGKTLVTGGYDKTVKSWNVASGELIRTFSGHTGWVVSLAFSHDGETLASGSYDRSVRLWNVADGQERRVMTGHTATIRSLAFSHDGKLVATGSADRTVRLWETASGEELATLAGHEAGVRSVAFSSDDRLLASGSEDQTIKVWNVGSHDLHGTLTGHTDMVSAVAFAQQTLVSAGWDRTLRTWDADTLEQRAKLAAGSSEVVALAVSSDGRHLLTAGADQSLTLWKSTIVEGRRTGPLGDYRTFPWAAAFSPDGASVAVAAGGFEQETDLYLYDVATKAEKYKVTFPDSIRSIAFAPAGDVLALGFAKKRLLLVDAGSGREVAQLEAQPGDAPPPPRVRYGRVAFSADGKMLAASSYDDDIRIYDVEQRTLVKTLKGRKERILSFAFSPDRQQLISCSAAKPAVVWDLVSGSRLYSLAPQPTYPGVASVSYSPDGKLLATGFSKNTCCLWSSEAGVLVRTIDAHQGIVLESIFSADSKTLFTAGEDGQVKLWDVATGQLMRTYHCQSGSVLGLRLSPDGKSFVTTGREGQARLWWVLPPEKK